jgi:hypothetical protein
LNELDDFILFPFVPLFAAHTQSVSDKQVNAIYWEIQCHYNNNEMIYKINNCKTEDGRRISNMNIYVCMFDSCVWYDMICICIYMCMYVVKMQLFGDVIQLLVGELLWFSFLFFPCFRLFHLQFILHYTTIYIYFFLIILFFLFLIFFVFLLPHSLLPVVFVLAVGHHYFSCMCFLYSTGTWSLSLYIIIIITNIILFMTTWTY